MFLYPNKPIRIYNIEAFLATIKVEDWIVQPKYNGKRILMDFEDEVFLYGRNGQSFPKEEERLRPQLKELLLSGPFLLDGECVRDGRIIVWDIIYDDGSPQELPYGVRLNHLKSFLKPTKDLFIIDSLPCNLYQSILDRASAEDLEGLVFKNLNAMNLWGKNSTSECNGQFKYRIK